MPKAYLYNNFITRNIRFSNKEAMTNRTLNNFYGEVDVNGCQVTNTNSYVDIIAPDWLTDDVMFSTTYVRFNNDSSYEYMAFVDSIEPSNFNGEIRYYRMYITVDWWSTIMWNDNAFVIENIKEKIEGNVVRAHVNDFVKKGSKYCRTLKNTTQSAEFSVTTFNKDSVELFDNTNKDQFYLYIISTKDSSVQVGVEQYSDLDLRPRFIIGEKQFKPALFLYVIPILKNLDGYSEDVYVRYYYDRLHIEYQDIKYGSAIRLINSIRDSSVVAMFISTYNIGFERVFNDDTQKFEYWLKYKDVYGGNIQAQYFDAYDSNEPTTTKRIYAVPVLERLEAIHIDIKNSEYSAPSILDEFEKPSSYDDYISNYITKAMFAPYYYVGIDSSTEKTVLNNAYATSDNICDVLIDGFGAGVVVYERNELKSGDEAYLYLPRDSTFNRVATIDEYTRTAIMTSGVTSATRYLGSLGNSASSFASHDYMGGATKAIGATAEFYGTFKQLEKLARDGETPINVDNTALSPYIKPWTFFKIYPIESVYIELKKDLAKYGYNTFLHPHEILLNHKRKYFNYIRCSNTSIDMPFYNTFIRKQIEEMFDNGVWLWNTNIEFGNFEVPNYCLIMEDENV